MVEVRTQTSNRRPSAKRGKGFAAGASRANAVPRGVSCPRLRVEAMRLEEEEVPVSQVLQLAPTLVPDSTSECCMACRRAFSLFFRRHHCRFCGRLLCGSCTAARVQVGSKRLRACEKCLETYTKRLQASREQRLLQQKQRELQRERMQQQQQQSVLPSVLTEDAEAGKEHRLGKEKEEKEKGAQAEEKREVEAAAEEGAARDSLRGRSFEQPTSAGKKAAAGRPRRSNTMLPSDRKSATMQPAATSGAKKVSYRKSLRSARSERQLRTAASSSFSAAPESDPNNPPSEEERASAGLQAADGSLARLTEEDGRASTVADVAAGSLPVTPTAEGDLVSASSEPPPLPEVNVIGMLPDIAAAPAPQPAADPLEEGCAVLYIGKDGVQQRATVLKAHFDDFPHLYYTIRLEESGRERQTDAARLQRL